MPETLFKEVSGLLESLFNNVAGLGLRVLTSVASYVEVKI